MISKAFIATFSLIIPAFMVFSFTGWWGVTVFSLFLLLYVVSEAIAEPKEDHND